MSHDLTKAQKRALRDAAVLAHENDRHMAREDRDVHYLEVRNPELPIVVTGAVVNGYLRLEDIGEAARDLIAGFAAKWQAVDARERPAAPKVDPYDPNAAVSLAAVVAEADLVSEETTLYVNRRTGDVKVLDNEFLSDDELELDEDDEPEWQVEARKQAGAISSDPDWVALLDSDDRSDRDDMVRFARHANPAASKELHGALGGRGGYRRFREVIHRRGLQKEWEAYRAERREQHLRGRLEELGIPFRK